MKRIILSALSIVLVQASFAQQKTNTAGSSQKDSFYTLAPAEVRAIRANENAPFTKQNLGQKELAAKNLGQDLPFLLNQTPSVVINSDAGNGFGYTGIRIRGTDASRINITINGVPFNDPESQGTFFVDLPDLVSSVGSIQIQRGIGSTSNGTGSFGANINLSTNDESKEAATTFSNTYGSFNSHKHTLQYNSGLHNGFSTSFRLSKLNSDGFIDRASSDLRSFYISNAYQSEKSSVRFNIFSGKEKTYQAWYGVSQEDLNAGNRTINYAGTERPGSPYPNETDNYTQTHYQLFYNHGRADHLQFNTAFFLIRGKGYYEQYKADQSYASYHLTEPIGPTGPITNSDFVRQLWLDNYYFGNNFSFHFNDKKSTYTIGGSATRYLGNHYGKLIWASNGLSSTNKWYNLDADKNEAALYFKQQTKFNDNWSLYYDIQARRVWHNINGFRDNPTIILHKDFSFLNPKIGFRYKTENWNSYFSYGFAGKEPNRDDFEASITEQPKAEKLHDIEIGTERKFNKSNFNAVGYAMLYQNQLVLTGKINDVGAYTRTNIPKSYRLGIELSASTYINKWLSADANLTLSSNRVIGFTEYVDNYDQGGQIVNQYSNTPISFSPAIISSATIKLTPIKNLQVNLLSKYVGKQFMDNTGLNDRALKAFYVQDFLASYSLKTKCPLETSLQFQINNLLNRKYEPNGYTYSYYYGGETVHANYYFPMAGINFMGGIVLKW
jgi:iron complex outermembrane receptor protein